MKVVAALALFFPPRQRGDARMVSEKAGAKVYPVSKVVTLLKDMQSQLEREAEEDEDTYEAMQCWCKTNDKKKADGIAAAQARIADLTITVETTAASVARLTHEIADHESDLAKAQNSLHELTALRKAHSGSFTTEEKEMMESIKALDAAIVVLSKHHPQAALLDDHTLSTVTQVVRMQMQKHRALLQGTITPHQRNLFFALAQSALDASQTPRFRSYAPQSGEIFGILRQMKETFESNLSEATKEELAKQKAFEAQKAAKLEEIAAITGSLEQKRTQLAVGEEQNARAKEDISDTRKSLSADELFLLDLKDKCSETSAEWESRKTLRQEEITAIVQAIAILHSDEARDTFGKTFNAVSFAQSAMSVNSQRREGTAVLLAAAASKAGDPKLAALALAARIDPFTKVKQAIDTLVQQLTNQKAAEVTQRDYCSTQLNENLRNVEQTQRDVADVATQIQTLEARIAELTSAMDVLDNEEAELKLQVKRAGENRQRANKDFQVTVTDQRETQSLLSKAIVILKAIYAKTAPAPGSAPSFLQKGVQEPAGPAAPPGFNPYARSAGGRSIIALLENISNDAKLMEAEMAHDEQTAQQAYEKFVKDTNAALLAKEASKLSKRDSKVDLEGSLHEKKEAEEQLKSEATTLANTNRDLHTSCDFLTRNFGLRQQSLDEEIEALREAKAVLSGMK